MNVIESNFPIKEVTVYPNAARIRRIQQVSFKKGRNELIIKGLPEIITEESVRIETGGSQSVKIIDIHSQFNFIDKYDENKYQQELKKVEELSSGQKKIEASFRNYTDEFLLFLNKENLSDSEIDDLHKSIVVKNWDDFFVFLRKKLTNNRNESRELLFNWINIQRRLEIAKRNLEALISYEKVKEHEIVALLEAPEEGEEEVHVIYIQPGVHWFPAYTLRADIDKNLISINLFGMITQTTGEDWENVRILLSTALPLHNCNIPEIKSKKIKEQDTQIIMTQPAGLGDKRRSDIADELEDLDMDGFDDEKEKSDLSSLMRKEKKKERARMSVKKKVSGMTKGFSSTISSPKLEIQAEQVKQSKEKISTPEKKIVSWGDLRNISDLVAGVDNKILPPFSPDTLSTYYKMLYTHLGDHFSPEQIVPNVNNRRVNKFFIHGVPLEKSVGGFDYRYKVVSIQKEIPSSSVPVQVSVDIKDLPITLLYTSIPLEKEVVYLKAVFTNEYDNPFPAGPAQIFVENNFLGNINFPTLGINQGTFVSLGTEQDIKVIRKEKSVRKTGGLVKKGVTVRFTVEIELLSYKPKPVVIEVLDRVPVSSNETDITILDIDYDPKPHLITDRNIVVWKETLTPKKKKALTISYSIKHPEDFRLTMQKGNHPYLGI